MYLHPNRKWCSWQSWTPVLGMTPYVTVYSSGKRDELWGFLDIDNYVHRHSDTVGDDSMSDVDPEDYREDDTIWMPGPSQVRVLIGIDSDGDPVWRYL